MSKVQTQRSRFNRYLHIMHDLAVQRAVLKRLRHHQFPVDFEPSHAKMGILVKEASEHAREILTRKSKS